MSRGYILEPGHYWVVMVDQKKPEDFRRYTDREREFYRLNHRYQTCEFLAAKKKQYLKLDHLKMGIWDAMEALNAVVDDSDPDTALTQIQHLLQTAEAIRADGHPDPVILAGLIHDLGKILCLFGEPQWAVVGDTFPLGCEFSDQIVFSEYFNDNPDCRPGSPHRGYYGRYKPGCGLDNLDFSWGHDEYLYQVVKDYLPPEALWMIRYHSAYVIHREGEYKRFLTIGDEEKIGWVKQFNPYDLYSKADNPPDIAKLRPYYEALIAKYFPSVIAW